MADRKRTVSIVIEARNEASKAFNSVLTSMSSFKGILLEASAAAAAMTFALVKITEAASKQEDADVRLAIALASIGENTAAARAAMGRLATQLEETSTVSDEAIEAMVSKLIQLGRVGLDQIPRVARATLDLAAVTGQDLEEAAILMSRAAQGQTQSLTRYGIVLDESIPRSQRFAALLELIEKNFGGTAQTASQTFSGALRRIGNDWDNLLQAMGKAVIENQAVRTALQLISDLLKQATQFVSEHSEAFRILITWWARGAIFLTRLSLQFAEWETEVISSNIRIAELVVTLGTLGAALGAIVEKKFGIDPDELARAAAAAAKLLIPLEEAHKVSESLGDAARDALADLEKALASLSGKSVSAAGGIKNFGTALTGAADPAKKLNDALKDLGLTTLDELKAKATAVDEALAAMEEAFPEGLPEKLRPAFEAIESMAESLPGWTEDLSAAIVPFVHTLDKGKQFAEDMREAFETQLTTAVGDLGAQLVGVFFGAKLAFKDLVRTMLQELARIATEKAFLLFLKFIGLGAGASAGPAGAAGAGIALGGGVEAFQSGGEVRGGIPGLDSVAALLMPGEIVLPTNRAEDFEAMTSFAKGAGRSGGTGTIGRPDFNAALQVLPRRDDHDLAWILEGLTELVERRGYRLVASEVLP